ncbi:UNVERIFIED_CONTAM: Tetratricopeptide repeat protein 28 [Gekko kuhli]
MCFCLGGVLASSGCVSTPEGSAIITALELIVLFHLQISLFGSKNYDGSSPEPPLLSKSEFVEKVRQSNQACHEGDFHRAVALYSETLGVDPQNCILYSNRSAAYMKTQQYDRALDDAIKARLLNPKWPKLHEKAPVHFCGRTRVLLSGRVLP